VEDELFSWVVAKHNGFVSRISKGQERHIRQHCRQVVKSLESKTCQAVRDYYSSILLNDLLYPEHIQHLYDYMRHEADTIHSSWFYCKCGVSGSKTDLEAYPLYDDSLPSLLQERLIKLATAKKKDKNGRLIATMRKRQGEYPFVKFARRLLNTIWEKGAGEANINFHHLNLMLDLGPDNEDRHMAVKYKGLLAEHDFINGCWERYIRRGRFSSKYEMTDWVRQAFAAERPQAVSKSA